jgi:hypothetical protein
MRNELLGEVGNQGYPEAKAAGHSFSSLRTTTLPIPYFVSPNGAMAAATDTYSYYGSR